MSLSKIAIFFVLIPLYGALGILGYWFFLDELHPVNKVKEFVVLGHPFKLDAESIVTTRLEIEKLRECKTLSVTYALRQNGLNWVLANHGGYQRPAGENTYINTFIWPRTAPYGTYRVCYAVQYECNPIRGQVRRACTDSFTVK